MLVPQAKELVLNSARFEEGTLVGYNLNKGPALGVVTKSGPGVVRIFIRGQKEFPVKINSIFVQGDIHPDKSRLEWVQVLEELESQSEKARFDTDLSLLHESILEVSSAQSYPLKELVDFYYGKDFDLFHVMGLARALCQDRCYFKRRKDQFTPSTLTQIEEYLRLQEKLAQKLREEEETVLFLQSPAPMSKMDQEQSQIPLEALIELSIQFERSPQYEEYCEILSRSGIQTRSALDECS